MSDLKPFLEHANIEVKAEQIAAALTDEARDALLLYMAYKKWIRLVPNGVMNAAINAFSECAVAVPVPFDTMAQASAVMDKAANLLWPKDERESRAWLLKVE